MEFFSNAVCLQTCALWIQPTVSMEAVVHLTDMERKPPALAATSTKETGVKQGQVSSKQCYT